ncbi:phenylacetate-CoA oxygenase subunit PaaC [Azospirillum doebereinerae]|uniref:Phenylacetate-CoA oxygenase subunit PaaI n=2 Tax=Azospirillum doebereinerae TaxID=92933 RepID=A0A3S0XQ47_9PROT|nr:1,2-phenylacetyl-CoA epoxidase subunit PaaC [Azospirillum doebereinerae]MCG5238579.1 phenylacetate-CoA oxygenase subunit PaaC [Azospirillum doebereinerae]RUQ74700.1 phenylacetate-CoA oxygenase subunit PaaI [Azospirillum doebereinerae]
MDPETRQALFGYALRLGDTSLVLGHRLSEWCGHAPELEEDIALTNVALDLVGHARLLLAYAGEVEGEGRDEDRLAYRRDVLDYRNHLLAEQPNRDFGHTIVRQFLHDAWAVELYDRLAGSTDAGLAGIAAKAVKEVRYHVRHSGDWLIRLGDGTDVSHTRMRDALERLWPCTGEMFERDSAEDRLVAAGIAPDPAELRAAWNARVAAVLAEATLERPADGWMQKGGRRGEHSEHLGYLLAEMQFLPRAYPDAVW